MDDLQCPALLREFGDELEPMSDEQFATLGRLLDKGYTGFQPIVLLKLYAYARRAPSAENAVLRKALVYLDQQFAGESFECSTCGHSEPTDGCDSHIYLKGVLAALQSPSPAAWSDSVVVPVELLTKIHSYIRASNDLDLVKIEHELRALLPVSTPAQREP